MNKKIDPARQQLALKLKESRKKDREPEIVFGEDNIEGWGFRGTNLKSMSKVFQLDVKNIIRKKLPAFTLRNLFKKKEKLKVLDLGCHNGVAISQLAKYRNIEPHGISLARFPEWKKQKRVQWHIGHSERTGLPGNYFDFVYSHFGLTHSPSLLVAMRELHRILARGGEALFNLSAVDREEFEKKG